VSCTLPHFLFIQCSIRVDLRLLGYWLENWENGVRFSLQARRFAHLRNVLMHAQFYVKLVLWAPVLGVKRQGSRADNSALEVPRFRESVTVSPRPPYAFILCTGRKIMHCNSCFSHKTPFFPNFALFLLRSFIIQYCVRPAVFAHSR